MLQVKLLSAMLVGLLALSSTGTADARHRHSRSRHAGHSVMGTRSPLSGYGYGYPSPSAVRPPFGSGIYQPERHGVYGASPYGYRNYLGGSIYRGRQNSNLLLGLLGSILR